MRRFAMVEGNPFNRLREEMDRLFGAPASGLGFNLGGLQFGVFPTLNIWEENDNFHVEAEVPGLTLDGLDLSVQDDMLTLKGERTDGREEGAAFHRRERTLGKFERTVQLPAGIDGSKVEATLKDGVLHIVLPKAEAAKPRKIAVRGS